MKTSDDRDLEWIKAGAKNVREKGREWIKMKDSKIERDRKGDVEKELQR